MTSYQLVHAPTARSFRRRPARPATFAFAFEVPSPSSDGEASVWIVDAQGILMLPADRARLGLTFRADAATETRE